MRLDTNLRPSQKVTAGALGGALATVISWGVQTAFNLHVPPGLESAFATILASVAAYFKVEPND